MKTIYTVNELALFTECSYRLNKFGNQKKELDNLDDSIYKGVIRIFFAELNSGNYPKLGTMTTYWGKMAQSLRESDVPLTDCNNIVMSLKSFYSRYKTDYYDKGYRVVAMNLPLIEKYESGFYLKTEIPVVLANKEGEIVPVFISNKRMAVRDNLIRFQLAVLGNKINKQIDKSLTIKACVSPTLIILDEIKVRLNNYLEQATLDINYVFAAIEANYNVPNTSFCQNCEFSMRCKI
jgi:hypothetical protein